VTPTGRVLFLQERGDTQETGQTDSQKDAPEEPKPQRRRRLGFERGRYDQRVERDKRWITQLNLARLNNVLWPLYVAFICLNFLDIYTTSIALSHSQVFQEHNVLGAQLFSMKFGGFSLALVLKLVPSIPLFYAVFVQDRSGKHAYHIRLVKISALFALVVGDAFYVLVVLLNNVPVLLEGIAATTTAAIFWEKLHS
jgi:hypothetical protein